MIDIHKVRSLFPILHQEIQGNPLIYFDNAATSQKPQSVIDGLEQYYATTNANVHRGIHTLAERSTHAFEATRETVRQFLNACSTEEIIYTKGTTESINLVAHSFGQIIVDEGDEVLISTMEHHSNIVPWQLLCERKKAILKVIPINDKGEILLDEFQKLLSERTKIVSVVHVSNTLGTINPIRQMIQSAHKMGAFVVVDGAQATPHMAVDVQKLDADFYAFSGHKVYAPTGIGILYGKKTLLQQMPPFMGGGEMIKEVTFEKTTYNDLPYKFEAGTPNIGDAVAFKNALDFVMELGHENIAKHENQLLEYATPKLQRIPNLRIVGTAQNKASVISFIVEDVHAMDLGMMLDANGIAVRTGNHCTMPLMTRLGIEGTTRASFAVYNTLEEIDRFIETLKRIIQMI